MKMRVRNILVPAIISLFFIFLISCNESPVNTNSIVNVSGALRGFFNYPVNNATVTIGGRSFTTSSDGKFSFPNVQAPYDLQIKDNANVYEILYKNVYTDRVIINLPVYGNLSSTYDLVVHYPTLPPYTKGKIYFMNDENDVLGIQQIESSTNMQIYAPQNSVLKGKVFMITYTLDVNQHVSDYVYFAAKSDVTIVSGTTAELTITQDDLKPVDEEVVSFQLLLPPQNTSFYSSYMLNFYDRRMSYFSLYQSLETFSNSNISFKIPRNLPVDFKPTIFTSVGETYGSSQQMTVLPKTGSNAPITLSPAPVVLSPENNAVNIDLNTTFTFTKQPISNVVIYTLRDTVTTKSYNLCTSDNIITLSGFSPMLEIAPGRKYSFTIEQIGVNANSIDEYLRNGRTIPEFSGMAAPRFFTTKQ